MVTKELAETANGLSNCVRARGGDRKRQLALVRAEPNTIASFQDDPEVVANKILNRRRKRLFTNLTTRLRDQF